MVNFELSDKEFSLYKNFIYDRAGITLQDNKKILIVGRLSKRLRHYGAESFEDYYKILKENSIEAQQAIDLLTTNETFFFRENKHFEFLAKLILEYPRKKPFDVWSAACSSGEEVYSIAMTLSQYGPNHSWSILGTDISNAVLKKAVSGVYGFKRVDGIPEGYLLKYCLKGTGKHAGSFCVKDELKKRVMFREHNLLKSCGHKKYDVIFLRNVLIYFDQPTKLRVLQNLKSSLKPEGYLITSLSESLQGMEHGFKLFKPSIYQLEEN